MLVRYLKLCIVGWFYFPKSYFVHQIIGGKILYMLKYDTQDFIIRILLRET